MFLGFNYALEFHSPLEGRSPSGKTDGEVRAKPASEPVGGISRSGEKAHFTPHRFSLRTNRSASSSGFPLGKPDPQGGSELLSRRTARPLKGGVNFKGVRATKNRFLGLIQQPRQGGEAKRNGKAVFPRPQGFRRERLRTPIHRVARSSRCIRRTFCRMPVPASRGLSRLRAGV